MDRRVVPVALTAIALVLAGAAGFQARAGGQKGGGAKAHHEHFEACAKACAECMRECESCAHHCAHLVAQGKKEHLKTLGTCADCAEFCAAAARIVSRGGPLAAEICQSCAKACDVCGKACEQFPQDEHMRRCARECRECAEACREMVQHAGHKQGE